MWVLLPSSLMFRRIPTDFLCLLRWLWPACWCRCWCCWCYSRHLDSWGFDGLEWDCRSNIRYLGLALDTCSTGFHSRRWKAGVFGLFSQIIASFHLLVRLYRSSPGPKHFSWQTKRQSDNGYYLLNLIPALVGGITVYSPSAIFSLGIRLCGIYQIERI